MSKRREAPFSCGESKLRGLFFWTVWLLSGEEVSLPTSLALRNHSSEDCICLDPVRRSRNPLLGVRLVHSLSTHIHSDPTQISKFQSWGGLGCPFEPPSAVLGRCRRGIGPPLCSIDQALARFPKTFVPCLGRLLALPELRTSQRSTAREPTVGGPLWVLSRRPHREAKLAIPGALARWFTSRRPIAPPGPHPHPHPHPVDAPEGSWETPGDSDFVLALCRWARFPVRGPKYICCGKLGPAERIARPNAEDRRGRDP